MSFEEKNKTKRNRGGQWVGKFVVCILLLSVINCVGFLTVRAEQAIKMIPLYIGSTSFTVEIADTPEKQVMGLMHRKSVPDDYGMLFTYAEEGIHPFWMKNTLVHLDIIFLNRDKQVVDIYFNVPPCRADPCDYYPNRIPAQYVLELRGNRAKELGLKEGDSIHFVLD